MLLYPIGHFYQNVTDRHGTQTLTKLPAGLYDNQIFAGKFKSRGQSTTLYIGDPLDGSFSDENNRGYEIKIQDNQIDIWPYNTNKQSTKIHHLYF